MIGSRALAEIRAAREVVGTTRPGASRRTSQAATRVDGQDRGGDEEGRLRAQVVGELDGGQRADRGAAHAGTEDADRETALLRREPGVDEGDADGERRAGDAEEEAADQEQGVGVQGDEGDEQDRDDRHARDDREHHPAAVPVGQRADDDAAERADDHRDGDQQGHVGLGERRRVLPVSRKSGPSGLISAHAQKFTANPMVAIASISHGDLVAAPVRGSEVNGVVTVVPLARAARLPPWPSTVDLPTGWVMSGLLTGPPRDGWCLAATSAVDPRTSRQGRRSRPSEATGPLGGPAQAISKPTGA